MVLAIGRSAPPCCDLARDHEERKGGGEGHAATTHARLETWLRPSSCVLGRR
jgi:hypothetical protein